MPVRNPSVGSACIVFGVAVKTRYDSGCNRSRFSAVQDAFDLPNGPERATQTACPPFGWSALRSSRTCHARPDCLTQHMYPAQTAQSSVYDPVQFQRSAVVYTHPSVLCSWVFDLAGTTATWYACLLLHNAGNLRTTDPMHCW